MRKNVVCLLIFFVVSMFLTVMPVLAEEQAAPPQALTIQQLKEDTDFFFKTIEDTHPDIYFRISKADYRYYKDLCYEKIKKPITMEDYYKVLTEFLNKFSDGHTRVSLPARPAGKNLAPPFLTDWIDGHLVITKVFGDFPIKAGDIILYINDISAQEYLDSKIRYSAYNDYQNARRQRARNKFYADFVSESKHTLTISSINDKVYKWDCPLINMNESKKFKTEFLSSFQKTAFKYYFWEDLNTGYLDWNAFLDRQVNKTLLSAQGKKLDPEILKKIPDFSEELEKVFKQLEEKKSKYFVVDIRGNGGGSDILGDQLLAYITGNKLKRSKTTLKFSELLVKQCGNADFYKFILSKYPVGTLINGDMYDNLEEQYKKTINKDFFSVSEFYHTPKVNKHFSGKLIILIDNMVFSSAEVFSVTCRDNNIGIFVGESTGGGSSHAGGVVSFIIPNSKIMADVSTGIFIRPDQTRINEREVYPDYYVYQTLEDFRAGKDTVLEFVKQGIKENKF